MTAENSLYKNKKLVQTLLSGGVVVMPTDTIYGLVARAEDRAAVEKIYAIKKRSKEKKLITLISDWSEIQKFGINPSKFKIPQTKEPTTFILEENAFRMPQNKELRDLLRETGPLVAPSANPEGLPPAKNIEEAKNYFGDQVDLYVDGGEIYGQASKIVSLQPGGEVTIIRE